MHGCAGESVQVGRSNPWCHRILLQALRYALRMVIWSHHNQHLYGFRISNVRSNQEGDLDSGLFEVYTAHIFIPFSLFLHSIAGATLPTLSYSLHSISS